MASRGGGGRNGTKVVFINTQYVEIDALDFKSVVQNLTGKDSVVPSPPPYSSSSSYASNKSYKNAMNYGAPPRLDAPPAAALVPEFDFDVDHHQQHHHRYSNDYYRPIDIDASVPVQYDSNNKMKSNNNIGIERGGLLMRDVSFKDIDRLLKLDLPPLDDLHTIFSDNYYS